MIPSDIVHIGTLKGGYGILTKPLTTKPTLIYNFSSTSNYKDISLILTAGTIHRSWSAGLKCFGWHEREVIEMSGAAVVGTKDSRNLLLDYGYSDRPSNAKNKLTADTSVYYSCYSNSIRISNGSRPAV